MSEQTEASGEEWIVYRTNQTGNLWALKASQWDKYRERNDVHKHYTLISRGHTEEEAKRFSSLGRDIGEE